MNETTIKNALLGAWELLAWEIGYSDQRPSSHPFGTDARGHLLYTQDGFMSAGIARAGRPAFGSASARFASAEQKAVAFDGYFHYQGPFHIEGENVVHLVSESLNPDFPGTRQVRKVRFEDAVLVLSAEDRLPGTQVQRFHRLRWQRAGSSGAQA